MRTGVSCSQILNLKSRAWHGDESIKLPLPARWRVSVCAPQGAAKIDRRGIVHAFRTPIGTKRIVEAAAGRRSAAIVVDDLSRPTPAHAVLPYILGELEAAGIDKENISIVVAVGSHRPLTKSEISKKLGERVATKYAIASHDWMADDLIDYGTIRGGTPVYINRTFAKADFKICVGGTYPHKGVGFGGGAKLILPGLAGLATISHFHKTCANRGLAIVDGREHEWDKRHVCESAANLVGIDTAVNCVVNGDREIAGVFVGDFVRAHRAAARFAQAAYATCISASLRREAQLIICNAYPMDSDPVQGVKAIWPRAFFEGDPYVLLINAACDGILYHGVLLGISWEQYVGSRSSDEAMGTPTVSDQSQLLVFSESFRSAEFKVRHPNGLLFRNWSTLVDQLSNKLPEDAAIAVFPNAPIQILDAGLP